MKIRKNLLACIALACPLLLPSIAAAKGEGSIRSLKNNIDVRIFADKTSEYIEDFTTRAVDRQGVDYLGTFRFNFTKNYESIEVLTAETIKANGEHIPVAAGDIKTQDGVLNEQTSSPENQIIQVTFPKLDVGDAIHLRYKRKMLKLMLPTGSSGAFTFVTNLIFDNVNVSIESPSGMQIAIDTNRVKQVEDKTTGTQRIRRWHYQNTDTETPEPYVVNSWRSTPYLMWSTFENWKAIADGYQKGVAEKAVITPQIRELAAKITAGKTSRKDQVEALYDWVRLNIRYVASYVGNGGFVPHDTASILEHHYGDCKDHATLLEALLQAQGIESSQALVQADLDSYFLHNIPIYMFSHVITYVPSLNLFLDSTAEKAPFGILPKVDSDKPVLLTKNFTAPGKTPAITPDSMKMVQRVRIQVAADGSAVRTTEVENHGLLAIDARAFLDGIGKGKEADWAKSDLMNSGYRGSADFEEIKSDSTSKVSYRLTQRISNYIHQPEASSINFRPGIGGVLDHSAMVSLFADPERHADFACPAFTINVNTDIILAPELKAIYIPKDIHLREGDVTIDSDYKQNGNTITSTIHIGSNSPKAWCKAEEYAPMRKIMTWLDKVMDGRMLFINKEQAVLIP